MSEQRKDLIAFVFLAYSIVAIVVLFTLLAS